MRNEQVKGSWRRMRRRMAAAAACALLACGAWALLAGRPAEATATATDPDIVVSGTTTWQYRDDNQVPADGWKTSAEVSDAAWKEGKGAFGAKKGQIADLGDGCVPDVLLSQYIDGDKNNDDVPVYYFRTVFDVDDPAAVTSIEGSLLYDDAATVYINGVKVAGFDDEQFDQNGYGGSNASAPKTGEFTCASGEIAALNLKSSGNVIAVELHQGRASSSDIYLDVTRVSLKTGATEQDIKAPTLQVGAIESERNFNWLSTSDAAAYAEVVAKPVGWTEGDAFPADAVQRVKATQSGAERAGYTSNKATVSGLAANTTYLYRLGNDEKWTETASFTTGAQGTGASFSFLFAGDPQIGASGNAANDLAGWTTTLSRAFARLGGNFLVSAGDQINDRGTESQYDAYYQPETLRSLAQAVTVGNHDNKSARYTDYNNMPNVSTFGASDGTGAGSGDYYYTYNGVLFMDLNSNNLSTAEHKAFMEQAIARNPNATWKIVVFHHSTFSLANHYSDKDIVQRRQELPQVFSELGIDVVLMGHDHYFTRTYLMDGTTPVVPEGHDVAKGEQAATEAVDPAEGQVLYLTANSASGSKYYSMNGSLAENALPGYVAAQDQSNRPSITNVTVSAEGITLDTYYTDTDELQLMDSFSIKRTGDEGSGDQDGDHAPGDGEQIPPAPDGGGDQGQNQGQVQGQGTLSGTDAGKGGDAKKSVGSKLPKTGDDAPLIIGGVAAAAAVALAAGAAIRIRMKRMA